jgi:raffinose/stachyose/melibiose transport system permease protein
MRRNKTTAFTIIKWFFLWGFLIFQTFPLIQLLSNSLRPNEEIQKFPLGVFKKFVITNYPETWIRGGYARAFLNSIIVGFATIVLVLVLVGLAAYALSKLEFKGREFFIVYFLMAMSIPAFAYLIPVYFLFDRIGLTNNLLGIILLYTGRNIPFNLLLLRTFLLGIPRELEETAKVEGCNELTAFLRITMPIAKSMFLTIALLIFLNTWNEFLFANTFLVADRTRTVATRFIRFTSEFSMDLAKIFTAGVITILPIVVLYLCMQKEFIEGLTSGSVKG